MPRRLPILTDTLGEIVEARTAFSKSFAMPGGARRILCKPSLVHYRDVDGTLKDIELDSMGANLRLDRAPYILTIRPNAIAMRYESRASGEVITCELVEIGGVSIASLPLVVNPERARQDVRWVNCLPGLTIVLRCQPGGVSWIKRIEDATVPRSFTWRITRPSALRGILIMEGVRGRENLSRQDVTGRRRGWPLDVLYTEQVMSDDGTTVTLRATETWTGRVKVARVLVDDPIYPVELDPSFQELLAANSDDLHEVGGALYDEADKWTAGEAYGVVVRGAVRFIVSDGGAGPNNGATINSATLTFDVAASTGSPATDIVGDDRDNSPTWSYPGHMPSGITPTTATVAFDPVGTGSKVATITSIVQELVDRVGWAVGSGMGFVLVGDTTPAGNYNNFDVDAINDAAGAETVLDITYTAAGGATWGPLLGLENNRLVVA